MQVYLWLKAFHIAAATTWISGLVVAGLAVASRRVRAGIQATQDTLYLDTIRRWDRSVTLPAMLLTWALGIAMAMQGGWFSYPWLMIKLTIVGALLALHGVLSGTLRRLARSADQPAAILLYTAPATILGIVMIAILVVMKPF
jgi:putative membrane protein